MAVREMIKAAQARAEAAEKELASFKERVLRVAADAKDDNNWCDDGYRDALAELGLPLPTTSYTVKVAIYLSLDEADEAEAADKVLDFLYGELEAKSAQQGFRDFEVDVERVEEE